MINISVFSGHMFCKFTNTSISRETCYYKKENTRFKFIQGAEAGGEIKGKVEEVKIYLKDGQSKKFKWESAEIKTEEQYSHGDSNK